jgi:hypothetical protein
MTADARPDDPHVPAEGALRDTLAWVLQSIEHPATAAGDWIAYEVDPQRGTAAALLADAAVPLTRLQRARILYAGLRSDGETAEERAVGSRLAIACAAAAWLFHGARITNHDDAALLAAFRSVTADLTLEPTVREMVCSAERKLMRSGR